MVKSSARRQLRLAVVSILTPLMFGGLAVVGVSPVPPASAAPAPAAEEGREIATLAKELRADVLATVTAYRALIDARLEPAERRLLRASFAKADRQLTTVVRETTRLQDALSRPATTSSSARIRSAQARAQAAWARAQMSAEESFTAVRERLEPQLTLIEKLRALNDYSALLARFEDLGERIDTVTVR